MLFFTTKSGKTSKINVFMFLVLVLALVDIWIPFIPAGLRVYEVPFVATLTLFIRTFFPSSGDVKTGL